MCVGNVMCGLKFRKNGGKTGRVLVARGFKKFKKIKNLPLQVPPQTRYTVTDSSKYFIYCNNVMYCTKFVLSLLLNKVDLNE